MMASLQTEIRAENRAMVQRHERFREAAELVTAELAKHPAVLKVMLIGSVAQPLKKEVPRFRRLRRAGAEIWHECKDMDLAVWVSDLSCLRELNKARGRGVNGTFVAHHQVEIFVMEPGTDRYLGRLCTFGSCPKEGKVECLVPGCGDTKFLKLDRDFEIYSDALALGKTVLLFERK